MSPEEERARVSAILGGGAPAMSDPGPLASFAPPAATPTASSPVPASPSPRTGDPTAGAGGAGGAGAGGASSGPFYSAGGAGAGPVNMTPVAPLPQLSAGAPVEGPSGGEASRAPSLYRVGGSGGTSRARLELSGEQRQGIRVDPEALAAFKEAAENQGINQALAANEAAGISSQMAEQKRAEADQLHGEAEARRAKVEDAMAQFQQQIDLVKKKTIDPSAYWTKRGPLMTALAALGRGLTAYGGGNNDHDIIAQGVDQEIAAQKADIENAREGLQAKKNLLDHYMKTNDPETAETLARATLKESMAYQLDAVGKKAAAQQARDDAQMDIAKLQMQQGTSTVTQAMRNIPAGSGGVAGGVVDPRILVQGGMSPEQADLYVRQYPREALAYQNKFLASGMSAGGTTTGKNGGGSSSLIGGPGGTEVAGFKIKDQKFVRQAIGLEAVDAGAEYAGKRLLQAIQRYKAATPGTAEFNEARMQVQTDYTGYVEARGKVDAGVNASGAPMALREYMMPRIVGEIGPDPSQSMASNAWSRVNPLQMSNVDRLEKGVMRSMSGARGITRTKIGVLATGKELTPDLNNALSDMAVQAQEDNAH